MLDATSSKETLKVTSNTSLLVTVSAAIEMKMTMNKYGFKVCRIKYIGTPGEQFLSFTAPEAFIYELGKPTNRREGYGPLALWPTLELARESVHPDRTKGFRCFECTYTPSADTKLWVPEKHLERIDPPQTPPKGTVLAESITLLRAVPWKLDQSFMPSI